MYINRNKNIHITRPSQLANKPFGFFPAALETTHMHIYAGRVDEMVITLRDAIYYYGYSALGNYKKRLALE
jgi:hypothetical protein